MKTIWKYPLLLIDGYQSLRMPAGARVLMIGLQQDHICLWAEVDPDEMAYFRRFSVHRTGHPIPPDRKYCGSVQQSAFVWHVYEKEGS